MHARSPESRHILNETISNLLKVGRVLSKREGTFFFLIPVDAYAVILSVAWSCYRKQFFISEPHKVYRRSRVAFQQLTAATESSKLVNTGQFLRFRHQFNWRSFLKMVLTEPTQGYSCLS